MSGASHSQGVFTQVLFEPGVAPHTFDSSSEIYEYLRHDIRKRGRIIGGNGIRGTLSRFKLRHREGASFFYGSIDGYVSPADLVTLLPKMFSDTQVSGTTFSASDTLPYFGILGDLDYDTIEFKNCKVDSWQISSRGPQFKEQAEPDMLYLRLDIFGSDRTWGTTWPVTPPTFGTNAANEPYVFSDCDAGVVIAGSTRFIEEFIIVGKNFLYPKYGNSLTPHSIIPRDRFIGFKCRVPWNSDNDGLGTPDPDGAAASITFTNGSVSTAFNFANLHIPEESPAPARGKQQVDLLLQGICTATGTTAATRELQIINDSTP